MGLAEDKWIGLGLAVSSSFAIGSSFIITKKGLIDAADRANGLASDDHTYLRNPIWWAGMSTMVIGEFANFAAYTFAPPILVTPLGALSVLIGAVLASFFLKEELGRIGKIGCTLCLVGSLVIVLHAPEDQEIQTVDEILSYAVRPGFMLYCIAVLVFTVYMIHTVVPRYGTREPIVYLSICSLVGSVGVMSIKGLGVAIKLTFAGNNQMTHFSTYVFAIVVAVCIMVQMNYFNKALDQFSTNVVNPIYYVGFSTATIVASLILFRGLGTYDVVNTLSLISGFIVTFLGVYLLNISRADPNGAHLLDGGRPRHSVLDTGVFPRMSVASNRVSTDRAIPLHHSGGSPPHSARRSGRGGGMYRTQDSVLWEAFPEEHVGLTRFPDDESEEDSDVQQAAGRPLNGDAAKAGAGVHSPRR